MFFFFFLSLSSQQLVLNFSFVVVVVHFNTISLARLTEKNTHTHTHKKKDNLSSWYLCFTLVLLCGLRSQAPKAPVLLKHVAEAAYFLFFFFKQSFLKPSLLFLSIFSWQRPIFPDAHLGEHALAFSFCSPFFFFSSSFYSQQELPRVLRSARVSVT